MTQKFETNEEGHVNKVHAVQIEWTHNEVTGRVEPTPIEGTEFIIEADYVFLAMGFLGQSTTVLRAIRREVRSRSNVVVANWMTTTKVSSPLVTPLSSCIPGVRAIAIGRKMALGDQAYLHIKVK